MSSFKTITVIMTMTALIFTASSCNRQTTVELAGNKLNVDVADNKAEQTQGLSGRFFLTDQEGMLFLFSQKDIRSFWMKDMQFPIDIVWIDENTVVDISPNVQPQPGLPSDQLARYAPSQPIDKVLELAAGWSARHGLKIGDRLIVH